MNANRKLAVVFDPSATWLEAVADALAAGGITVVGRSREREQTVALVERHRPSLLVADAAGTGLDVIRDARSRVPAVRAIALGTLGDADVVADAFEAGAAAFVVKSERFDSFGASVRELFPEPVVARVRQTTAA